MIRWLAASIILVAQVPDLYADVLVIPPDRDNTLYERPAGDLSNGSGPHLFFGLTGPNAGNRLRRAVLHFDLSSIPPGSTINNVELVIQVDRVPPVPLPFDASLHRLLADWGEGASVAPGQGGAGAPAQPPDATWLHREFNTLFWTAPGGDFNAQPSATAQVGAGTGPVQFLSTPGLVADVQSWVDDPATNFGWILLGDENGDENARRIGSRENSALAPVLTVDYEPLILPPTVPVPTLGAAGMLLLMVGVLLVVLRTRQVRTSRR